MRGWHHPERGYWETPDDVGERYIEDYPAGTVETPLRPVRDGYEYTWSGSSWSESAERVTAHMVNAERDRRVDAGFVYGGWQYSSDPSSRENIAGAATLALGAIIADPTGTLGLRWADPDRDFSWTTTTNHEVAMTAAQCLAFCQAAMQYKTMLIKAARNLKDQSPIPGDYADDNYWPSRTLD